MNTPFRSPSTFGCTSSLRAFFFGVVPHAVTFSVSWPAAERPWPEAEEPWPEAGPGFLSAAAGLGLEVVERFPEAPEL